MTCPNCNNYGGWYVQYATQDGDVQHDWIECDTCNHFLSVAKEPPVLAQLQPFKAIREAV